MRIAVRLGKMRIAARLGKMRIAARLGKMRIAARLGKMRIADEARQDAEIADWDCREARQDWNCSVGRQDAERGRCKCRLGKMVIARLGKKMGIAARLGKMQDADCSEAMQDCSEARQECGLHG